MDNQHRQIKGYRELSGNEITDMNMVKTLGTELENMLQYLRQSGNAYDARWLAIGETHLQQGLMAVTRAIAQPTTF